MFFDDIESGEEMWDNGEFAEGKAVSDSVKKVEKEHKCACGRKVCCGKHKKGQCACGNRQKERD